MTTDDTVPVTGASSGIGAATVRRVAADAVAFALAQDPPTTVNELYVYQRDKFGQF